jgi:hypothetical protein
LLSAGPTVTTTIVGEDVDGGPPWGVLPMSPVVATTIVYMMSKPITSMVVPGPL